MKAYIGLDVHSKFTVYTAQDEEGRVLGRGKAATSLDGLREMVRTLKIPAETEAALETGSQAFLVSRHLLELGLKPVVVDAREVRAKARSSRQKSDSRDAYELCDGLRRGIFTKVVYVPPAEIQRLRRLLSRRRHFVRVGTMEVNAAKYLLRALGLSELVKTLTSAAAWEKLLGKAEEETRMLLECHYQVWRAAKEQQEKLEAELKEALTPFRTVLELLMSTPGVGPVTAARPTHPLNPYFMRVLTKGGYKKAVVCVAQRLARILYQMWKKGEKFDPEKLNVVNKPTERKKLVYWVRKDDRATMSAAAKA